MGEKIVIVGFGDMHMSDEIREQIMNGLSDEGVEGFDGFDAGELYVREDFIDDYVVIDSLSMLYTEPDKSVDSKQVFRDFVAGKRSNKKW